MPNTVSVPSVDITSFFYDAFDKFAAFFPTLAAWMKNILGVLVALSFPLSLFFLIGIIYCVEQLKYIRKQQGKMFEAKVVPAFEEVPAGDQTLAKRWDGVKTHITSDNPNDWRQAIIDADIILDDILNKMGYRGESVGEKLKHVAKGDFATLDDAWEAHKTRNQITHEGSGFALSHHEAKKAIDLYKKVFEEFYYV
jgi:hypothetical protein